MVCVLCFFSHNKISEHTAEVHSIAIVLHNFTIRFPPKKQWKGLSFLAEYVLSLSFPIFFQLKSNLFVLMNMVQPTICIHIFEHTQIQTLDLWRLPTGKAFERKDFERKVT